MCSRLRVDGTTFKMSLTWGVSKNHLYNWGALASSILRRSCSWRRRVESRRAALGLKDTRDDLGPLGPTAGLEEGPTATSHRGRKEGVAFFAPSSKARSY